MNREWALFSMTAPQASKSQSDLGTTPLSLWQILLQSTRLYLRHWKPFTQVLVTPMLLIMGGLYSCLILSHWAMYGVSQHISDEVQGYVWPLLLVGILVISIATLIWFCVGAWQYAIYFGSLNINAQEVLEEKPVDFKQAYQSISRHKAMAYKGLLSVAYALLPALAIGTVILFCIIGAICAATGNMMAYFGLMLAGFGISALILLIWAVLLIPLSFVVQIATLEAGSLNPMRVFMRSTKLVFSRFWTTLGLQILLFAATNYIVPMPLTFISRKLSLTLPLDKIHHWIMTIMVESMQKDMQTTTDPMALEAFTSLQRAIPSIAHSWTDLTFVLIITALLLPWGTFAFTLLYRDILKHAPVSLKPEIKEANFQQAAEREAS